MTILLEPVVRYWACPSCSVVDQTQRADAHTQMHSCPALRGFTVPLVEVQRPDDKPDGRHVVNEREDYLRDENADRVMSVTTDHGDGSNDCTVYAPTAIVKYQF